MAETLEIASFTASYTSRFLLALVRVLAALSLNPFLGAGRIPGMARVGLAIFVTVVLFPPGGPGPAVEVGPSAVIGEALVGLAAGFAVTLIFFAAQMAAGLIGVNAGFSSAAIIDPFFDGGSGVIERFFSAFAMLVFIQINGHHLFLVGLRDLFDLIEVGSAQVPTGGPERVTALLAGVFVAGVKMALPVLAALLLADLALAILSKVAPQFNLLAVGIPVKLIVGLGALLVALPIILPRLIAVFRLVPGGMAGLAG